MDPVFITARTVLGPDGPLEDAGLLIENGRIRDLLPAGRCPGGVREVPMGEAILAPGLIDLQINGGGGVLFNDAPSSGTIETIAAAHRAFGTTAFLPTLISDSREAMRAALAAAEEAIARKVPGVLGLHLEGPFLAPPKKGIHDDAHFTAPGEEDLALLGGFEAGALMLTLAPERVGPGVIRRLAAKGVRVAAGHTAASYEETSAALEAGLSGFTHLFNAMPQLLSRDPGPVAAALESGAWCSLIADGHHVDPAMLRLAIRAKSDARLMFVSDAMATVGAEAAGFDLGGRWIRQEGGRLVDESGTLAGAHLTMIEAVRFGVDKLGLGLWDAVRMASAEPADFLGIGAERGRLLPGAAADILVLEPGLAIRHVLTQSNLTRGFAA